MSFLDELPDEPSASLGPCEPCCDCESTSYAASMLLDYGKLGKARVCSSCWPRWNEPV